MIKTGLVICTSSTKECEAEGCTHATAHYVVKVMPLTGKPCGHWETCYMVEKKVRCVRVK